MLLGRRQETHSGVKGGIGVVFAALASAVFEGVPIVVKVEIVCKVGLQL